MQKLFPDRELLAQEYVLVQAWKKVSSYIRYHNWFADTLALDETTANLPEFIGNISSSILSNNWIPDKLRIVSAPKSQPWQVNENSHLWRPSKPITAKQLRPLANASLKDQVVCAAIMLCLSERVETLQGDPRLNFAFLSAQRNVTSYGNRLFCDYDESTESLVHRWGSSRLYRAYFDDYKAFIARPEYIAERFSADQTAIIIQSDLKQFYDRVRPTLLSNKLSSIRESDREQDFFSFASSAFDWRWHKDDLSVALAYARETQIPNFESIALPQGLVASGFFANIVLLDFDALLRKNFNREIIPGVFLRDACRYVDDLRLTVSAAPGLAPSDIAENIVRWLDQQFESTAPGLLASPEKTKAALYHGEEQPLIRQAKKMQRIQTAISGGFDAAGGEEVIQAVQGLIRSQAALSSTDSGGVKAFTPVPDVRDETIGRFAAGRFRTTFRSLRPLLEERTPAEALEKVPEGEVDEPIRSGSMSQADLDEEAQAFALGLVNTWIRNPANVRLLRVAVDLWPTRQVGEALVSLFRPYISGKRRGAANRVAFYCLAELLRAGATETGIVPDEEMLPASVDLPGYREALAEIAIPIVASRAKLLPWYLRQQAALFLMVHFRSRVEIPHGDIAAQLGDYARMAAFLKGAREDEDDSAFATLAVVTRRSFMSAERTIFLLADKLTPSRFKEIAGRDLEFAREIFHIVGPGVVTEAGLENDLPNPSFPSKEDSLAEIVRASGSRNPLRNELGILSFSISFLNFAMEHKLPPVITPTDMQLSLDYRGEYGRVSEVNILDTPTGFGYRSIYTPPSWVTYAEKWRFQLGFLLRFILTAKTDFSVVARGASWKEDEQVYRPTRSHWLQRLYGFYNGHEAFGDNWVPISQFTQNLLYSLLSWPGCRAETKIEGMESMPILREKLLEEYNQADRSIGEATGMLVLKQPAPLPVRTKENRPLRACVVQSITPDDKELAADIMASAKTLRRKHRNHLSTALSAVEKMLDLRETHKGNDRRLDWLIFPELAVHPADIETHLVPFARKFKTIILAGLTYQELFSGEPLVNSAIWVIPRRVEGQGLQITTRLQGKQFLAPLEEDFNVASEKVRGFRPCQWLIGYDWTNTSHDPLWLTAAICYDATDLRLASDLREKSDIFAIPALNQDVGTFDQMAQALHYHMYQLVLIANNGTYGGSNAYVPQGEPYRRQVFHTHGQPQATISFLEIDDIGKMKDRRNLGRLKAPANLKWKFPPAGH